MNVQTLKALHLPDNPGIYLFKDQKKKILYIGKATSIKDRVRSYFSNDLMHTRGKHIVDMVTMAETVDYIETDSVLEALILESAKIKALQPTYNTKEKDNKSFNYVVITKEIFPKVLTIRERNMFSAQSDVLEKYDSIFGPFPQGSNLEVALKIVRKMFPFRDKCTPNSAKPCFDYQIGLCPGVCSGAITTNEYRERIKEIKLFFRGNKPAIIKRLVKKMNEFAQKQKYEEAGGVKRKIFALEHIKDVSLISNEVRTTSQESASLRAKAYRIEGYDIAHISGKHTVGVMVVIEDGKPKKSAYRKFKIRIQVEAVNDLIHLDEILRRRLKHVDWQIPDLIVVDGNALHKRRAEKVIKEMGFNIPVVSVVKDEHHKAKAILGGRELVESYRNGILIANMESHRFAVLYHRQLRDKMPS